MAAKSPYSPELRRRAVRMVGEVRPQYPTEWAAITAVAEKLEIGTAETFRTCVWPSPDFSLPPSPRSRRSA